MSNASELKKKSIEELEENYRILILSIRQEDIKNMVLIKELKRGSDISGNEGKLMSRIQSLEVIRALNQIYQKDKNISNKVITNIMRYALSIQTDKFQTPRYLRII